MRDKQSPSELTTTAEALHTELKRYESLVDAVKKAPLNSQKHLERAAKMLTDLADAEERLGGRARELLGAIAAFRNRQQSQAEEVQARALELQHRTEVFRELMARYGALGEVAGALNGLMRQVAQRNVTTESEMSGEIGGLLEEVNTRMTQVAEEAQAIAKAADEEHFNDIAQLADSLRQQLLSARNKMNLLQKSLIVS